MIGKREDPDQDEITAVITLPNYRPGTDEYVDFLNNHVIYTDPDPANTTQDYQAKLWVGGENANTGEYEQGAARCLVAYIRAMSSIIWDTSGLPHPGWDERFQAQQWRNIDRVDAYGTPIPPPSDWDDKWPLEIWPPPDQDPELDEQVDQPSPYYLRLPRPIPTPVNPDDNKLTIIINCDKFGDFDTVGTYKYELISLEKLEEKLHLMSKYPPSSGAEVYYKHIAEDLDLNLVFNYISFYGPSSVTSYNNNPIVAEGIFTPYDGQVPITVSPLYYEDPDPPSGETPELKTLSDFMLVIKPMPR